MARIREALQQANSKRGELGETVLPPHPYQPDEDEPIAPQADEEIPFIEVGGTIKPMEASASVLAQAAGNVAKDLPRQDKPMPAVAQARSLGAVPSGAEVKLFGLAFRPVPGEEFPLAPAEERLAPELVAFHQPSHAISEQYRTVVAGMASQLPAGQSHILLFTAPAPRTGTTTVLVNLAITRARQGRGRVVMVDANLRRPGLAGSLGLPVMPGLGEVLRGSASLQRVTRETGQPNLHVLAAGPSADGGHLLIASASMRAVLRQLRSRFDWVLVDAPCWDGRAEVVALGSACDAVYLVLPQAKADSPEMEDLLQLVPQQGSRLRGCIFLQL